MGNKQNTLSTQMKTFCAIIVVLAIFSQINATAAKCGTATIVADKVINMAAKCAEKHEHGLDNHSINQVKGEVESFIAKHLGCRRRRMTQAKSPKRDLSLLCYACAPSCKLMSTWASDHLATYGIPEICTRSEISTVCNKHCEANC